MKKDAIFFTAIILLSVIMFCSGCGASKAATPEPEYVVSQSQAESISTKGPEFPGGTEAMYKFIAENVDYPVAAIQNNIQGTVEVSFVIEKDGSITDCQVTQSVHTLLDQASLKVVRKMPKWSPAWEDGKPIRFNYSVPVKFHLGKAVRIH